MLVPHGASLVPTRIAADPRQHPRTHWDSRIPTGSVSPSPSKSACNAHGFARAARWNPAGSCIPRIRPSSWRTAAGISLGTSRYRSSSPLLVERLEGVGHCADLSSVLHFGPGIRFDQRWIDLRQHVGPTFAKCLERPRPAPRYGAASVPAPQFQLALAHRPIRYRRVSRPPAPT